MERNLKDINDIKYYSVTRDNPIIIKLDKTKQKSLYHYTTKEGVKGIVNSNTLWVTHSDFLDDKTEVKYIHYVLCGVIKYLKQNRKLYKPDIMECVFVYEKIIKTLEALKDIYVKGAPISGASLFILSLTEHKKNKYLIENYCKNSGGILEFSNDINYIKDVKEKRICCFMAKVEYDLAKQMTIILEDINEFWCELSNTLISEEKIDYLEVVETIKSIIYTKIINYSFFFKHRKYSKEKEYRLMFLANDEYCSSCIRDREKYNKKIPYIEIKFDDEMLRGVTKIK